MPQLDKLQEEGRLKNLAIIYNGSELKKDLGYGAYGYGYGYGYGFGYGFGYAENDN